ncbi:hypothetical protein BDV95DRAFT_611268 [Massariosphaeria phaeospora]|uniref:Uncharacterized protein n=1 Tax=Massariosphaeria phaeospora TaxID=100035 RepID=A0A7C8M902_9PLEO|nr:hypothetical protein BDV95DRAFT_611268 [Massariosphaeria phaeospora]
MIVQRNDVFIILDAGGGTVDAATFRITSGNPLRLGEDVCEPTGRGVGASDINHAMEDIAFNDLKDETYLEEEDGSETIRSIISCNIMPTFERLKRQVSYDVTGRSYYFRICRLKKSLSNNRLRKGEYVLAHQDMLQLFDKLLEAVKSVLEEQLKQSKLSGVKVDKVVLVGGFGDSPLLRHELKQNVIEPWGEKNNEDISLICAPQNTSAPRVSRGAIIRAADKSNGPARVARLSFALVRDVPCQGPELVRQYPELSRIEEQRENAERYKLDGLLYLKEVLFFILKVGDEPLQSEHKSKGKLTEYYFEPSHSVWKKTERVYVSDVCKEDYWQVTNPINKDKVTCIGEIEVDLTPYKDDMKVTRLEKPPVKRKGGGSRYLVQVLLQCTVVDRDITFEVRWPAERTAGVVQQKAFSFAAAFAPGTEWENGCCRSAYSTNRRIAQV